MIEYFKIQIIPKDGDDHVTEERGVVPTLGPCVCDTTHRGVQKSFRGQYLILTLYL